MIVAFSAFVASTRVASQSNFETSAVWFNFVEPSCDLAEEACPPPGQLVNREPTDRRVRCEEDLPFCLHLGEQPHLHEH
jgi:hypothetical protein